MPARRTLLDFLRYLGQGDGGLSPQEPPRRILPLARKRPVPVGRSVTECDCCWGSGKLWEAPPDGKGTGRTVGCCVCGATGWREVER